MKKLVLLISVVAMAMCTVANAQEASAKRWKTGLDVSAQATQNYISKESSWSSAWYNGGTSNLSALAGLKGWFNYADDNGWSWDNEVELRYGVSTTFTEDKVGRKWHLTDDKTSYMTKGGYAIGHGWNVAANADVNTTLFNNYIIDSNDRASAFASPVRFNAGIGFDYKYSNEAKKLDFSLMIAPYSYKLVYVNDSTSYMQTAEDGTSVWVDNIPNYVGIGRYNMLKSYNLGSRVLAKYRQLFNDDKIALESVLSIYTDYKGIEVDWLFTADFVLYKLLTARVSVNPRYDSTVDGGWDVAKLQLKELVSLGIAYRMER